jgi:hypothetical protein
MLSDSVFGELAKRTPLQRQLIEAAWPTLSAESKLTIIEAAIGPAYRAATPGYLIDLAQADSAEIVRYWASLHYYFKRPPENPLAAQVLGSEITQEEAARTQRLEADPSELVRTAGNSGGFLNFSKIFEMPQLARLVTIRKASHPATKSFAEFVKKAIAVGAPTKDICECIAEYFAREDVFTELNDLHHDGWGEFSKGKGWEQLWELAAKADPMIGRLIVDKAAVAGKFWHLKQEVIEALPPVLLETCTWRREDLFEKVRDSVRSAPDRFDAEIVKAVKSFDEMQAEFGTPTEEESEKQRLEDMHSRTDAVFESVQSLHESVNALKEWAERATLEAAANKKALEGLKGVGWLVAILVGLVLWLKH